MQAVTTNINPIRQEHTNKRDAGHVLPRDHDDQEPKKGFVGWDQDSSSAKDQGKNNMATERLTEKSMRKPGEDQSLVVKHGYLSNNVERDTKTKPSVVDNPTGYDPFLVGGDINQDDVSSKEKKSTPYSDPSKNVVDSVARTSSPLEKEKKEVDSKHTAMISSSEVPQYSQGDNPRVQRKTPSKEKENKEAAPFFVAEKNIAVPFSSTNIEARRNKTSTTTGSYGKGDQPKKGGCPCSIL